MVTAIRTAEQRALPTAATTRGDHVYPHAPHVSHFCVLRCTCACSLGSIGESLRRLFACQATKPKIGVAQSAENTSLY